MKTAVIKRSIKINGCKTSVSLENEFWDALHEIARRENIALSTLVEQINQHRNNINLSSAIRVFVFTHFRAAAKNEVKLEFISPDHQPADSEQAVPTKRTLSTTSRNG